MSTVASLIGVSSVECSAAMAKKMKMRVVVLRKR
ncbi:hypothetical protein L195_g016667 [Trifolium pratense]|uniref:Uncharacterized protein n=1 Tax=Trifolium pratense TaxID=57577 RepID=A0A2K3MRT2_TRIPR|nr:hypothetical protein L195_g016667 [Trifolium pratense]